MKRKTILPALLLAALSLHAQQPVQKQLYDYIVPDHGSFEAAIGAANSRPDQTKRFRIFVRRGSYVIPASRTATIEGIDGRHYPDPRTDLTASRVSIIGEGQEVTSVRNTCPDTTIATKWGPTCPIEGLRKVYTLKNSGTDNYLADIRLVNGMKDATGRGEALEEAGDRTICKGVGLWGYQDTYCSNRDSARYYFEGGVIRGRTDYLCGKGDIVFHRVEFRQCQQGGYISVPSRSNRYGYVMLHCTVTGEQPDIDGTYALGRPWGKGTPASYWINTTFHVKPSAEGWSEMSGGYPARFAEYGSVDVRGNALDLSRRKRLWQHGDNPAYPNNPLLTAQEAAQISISTVLGGSDGWAPETIAADAPVPTNVRLTDGTLLTWDDSPLVLCWAVCRDGVVWKFTTTPRMEVPADGSIYSVRAANERGGLGVAVKAGVKVRVHTIGDSTMADYAEMTTRTRGWGEMLGECFTPEVEVIDYARGGRSSLSFTYEGRWAKVKENLVAGDYVLIQFAHNDEHANGRDGKDYRGTAPQTTYRHCLRRYVDETRAAGAHPILVTPIVRRYFQADGTISAKGCHNIGADATTLNYVEVMCQVALEKQVPVVDLTALTKQAVEQMGDAESKRHLYVPTDNTHTQATGAAVFARLAVQDMKRQGLLAPYIVEGPAIVANPTRLHYGKLLEGDSKTLAFDLIGLQLAPTNGKLTLEAPRGMTLSTTLHGQRKARIEVDYSDARLWGQPYYLHFQSRRAERVNTALTVRWGSQTRLIPVVAEVANPRQRTAIVQTLQAGSTRGLAQTEKGFLPSTDGSATDPWQAEMDEVNGRYIEYVVRATDRPTAVKRFTLTVDGKKCYRVAYARGKDFYPRTDIAECREPAKRATTLSLPINETLYPGEALHIRIFPWSDRTNKDPFVVKQARWEGSEISF